MAQIVRLILTWERRGKGTDDDPVRLLAQLFTEDGKLVAEADTWAGRSHFEWPFIGALRDGGGCNA